MSRVYPDLGLKAGPISRRPRLWACGVYFKGNHIGCVFQHAGQPAMFWPARGWNFRRMRIEDGHPSWVVGAVMDRLAASIRTGRRRSTD